MATLLPRVRHQTRRTTGPQVPHTDSGLGVTPAKLRGAAIGAWTCVDPAVWHPLGCAEVTGPLPSFSWCPSPGPLRTPRALAQLWLHS